MAAPTERKTGKEFGEGNYKASKRFRDSEEAFVKKNRDKIPEMGKAARDALEGPEGKSLKKAAARAARTTLH
ncbi:MAG: hypothetical protein JSR60_03335 [Proteobacteria bacterium]|nr:hypothetical protein [Pseudomonadota bacterium]